MPSGAFSCFLSEVPSTAFTLFPCPCVCQLNYTQIPSGLVGKRFLHFPSIYLFHSISLHAPGIYLTSLIQPVPISLLSTPSRRYKHFDWLYGRLVERFPVISVPHLPEKQATGRFEEDFLSKRRKGLIWWMNHMTSHPVLAHCDVFQHFLTCGADEKAWKQGKRKAERDELVGANFFLTIR